MTTLKELTLVSAIALGGTVGCYEAVCDCLPPSRFVVVDVRDQQGSAVPGAFVTITDVAASSQNTNAAGRATWPALVGTHSVRVDLPTGYMIAPDQANPLSVRVEDNDTTFVLFRSIRPSQ